MTLTLSQILIVCPLVGISGFIDAVAGGGGLISIPAYMLAGLPVHMAIATNKLSAGMGTSLATYRYNKKGYIPWRQASFCVVCALIGAYLGAHLALLVDDRSLKLLMLVIVPLTSFYVLRGHNFDQQKNPYSKTKTCLIAMGVALIVGIYDGFYGPGAGTFMILLLVGVGHMHMHTANGLAKVISLTTQLTSLVVYLLNGKVVILLGFAAGLFALGGSYLGTLFFERVNSRRLKAIMLLVMGIFFIKLLTELF